MPSSDFAIALSHCEYVSSWVTTLCKYFRKSFLLPFNWYSLWALTNDCISKRKNSFLYHLYMLFGTPAAGPSCRLLPCSYCSPTHTLVSLLLPCLSSAFQSIRHFRDRKITRKLPFLVCWTCFAVHGILRPQYRYQTANFDSSRCCSKFRWKVTGVGTNSTDNLCLVFQKKFNEIFVMCSKKVTFSHTRYRALGPELIPVYRQSARR